MQILPLALLCACASPSPLPELRDAELFAAEGVVPDADGRLPLVVHFQGSPAAVAQEFRRSGVAAALLVSRLSGRSSAFATPYREDPERFAREIAAAEQRLSQQFGRTVRADPLAVSFFSAGYGAVRELLRDDRWQQRIDTLIALDSIHADHAQIDEQMAGFVRFAQAAARGEKQFRLVHSAIRTDYASTTACADHLLAALGLTREPARRSIGGIELTAEAHAGAFDLYAIAGDDAAAHVACLRLLPALLRGPL